MTLTYLIERLPLTLKTLSIHQLLLENHFSLETLAEDLTALLDENMRALLISTLQEDYRDWVRLSSHDLEEDEVLEELNTLLRQVFLTMARAHHRRLGRLTALHFQLPDCLILEYRSPSSRTGPPCPNTSLR